jgi:pseudaminic acid biosynthesis-associated methylase
VSGGERPTADAARLEALWAGSFGDSYTERNEKASTNRESFWRGVLDEFPVRRVLEVGCNLGANLRWIAGHDRVECAAGVDVNLGALRRLRESVPGARALSASARALPFAGGVFDLVFTMGVLIHQSPEALPAVMDEIERCSRRFVLCGEYFAAETTEVPYRGQSGALFKRDFGGLYQARFPRLALRKQVFLSRAEGWDDVTVWVLEKR